MERKELLELVGDLAGYLRYLEVLGVQEVPISGWAAAGGAKAVDSAAPEGSGSRSPRRKSAGSTGEKMGMGEKENPRSQHSEAGGTARAGRSYPPNPALAPVRSAALACQKCPLHRGRKTVVFGTGNENADILFIGEAPGADEDARGEPFVGRAGRLLTRLLEEIGLTREEVYIANIIKCRPPGNRNPLPEEIASCEPYLVQQLEIIRPQLICALGTFAAQTLLKTREPISRLRGRFHPYRDIRVLPTYHPAYVLRYPDQIAAMRADLLRLKEEYARHRENSI